MGEFVRTSAIAILTSGGAVAFLWWLIKRALETRFRESEARTKAAITRIEDAVKAFVHEDIRRAGAFYDDRYTAIKALFRALERYDARVLSLQVILYASDCNWTRDEARITDLFKQIKAVRDECSEIVEVNGFLISDSLRTKVTECQSALAEIVHTLLVANKALKQAQTQPPQPDHETVDNKIYEIRVTSWRELGLGAGRDS